MNDEKYARQIPLFGSTGQKKISETSVFIAGAGGLGSAVSTYLVQAGIGEIIIADYDVVVESNLNRQFLHATKDIGKKKVYSAYQTLHAMNPDITISAIPDRITRDNICSCIRDADLLVDATDNYITRFLLNETSQEESIPLIHGAVEGFSGQLTTIIPGLTPCLSCIFPNIPEQYPTPVLGATAGVIGSLQAMEVIKYITGSGHLLTGRLLIWDGLIGKTDYLTVSKRKDCGGCNRSTG